MNLYTRLITFFSMLDVRRRRFLLLLIIISLMVGILESLALSTIAPVASGLYNSNETNLYLPVLGSVDLSTALIIFLVAFLIRSAALVGLSFAQAKAIFDIQASISESLFRKYLTIDSREKRNININVLGKNVIVEAQAITQHGYLPMILIISDIIISFVLISYLTWVSGITFLATCVAFVAILLCLSYGFRSMLFRLGTERKIMDGFRYQYVNEAFEQRDLVFAHKLKDYFSHRYEFVNRNSAKVGGLQWGLNSSTRWIIEFLIVAIIACLALWNSVPLSSIEQLSISGGIIIRLLPLSSKLLSNLQKLDYSGPVLEELSQQISNSGGQDEDGFGHQKNTLVVKEIFFNGLRVKAFNSGDAFFDKVINLKLESGKTYAIVGPNGVGKSTFAKIIIGSVYATEESGFVSLKTDKNRIELPFSEISNILSKSLVPQDLHFVDASIKENLTYNHEFDEGKLNRLISAVGLETYLSNLEAGINTNIGDRFGYFSGGQRQRLAVVRALLKNSDILILDEPSSAADTDFTKNLFSIVREHAGNRITLIVTHSKILADMCDEVIEVTEESITNK